MNLGLQTRVAIVLSGVIFALIVSFAVFLAADLNSDAASREQAIAKEAGGALFAQVEKKAAAMSQLIAESITNELYFGRQEIVARIVDSAKDQPGISYIFVFDPEGAVFYDGTQRLESFGARVGAEKLDAARMAAKTIAWSDEELVHTLSPISVGSRFLGGVQVGHTLGEVNADTVGLLGALSSIEARARQRFAAVTATAVAVFVLIGSILGFIAARHFTVPIKKLAALASRYSSGEFEADPGVDRSDEIGELANAMKEMALARQRAEQQRQAEQMELAHLGRVNLMGEMAIGIAHELNQPLAAINNFIGASVLKLKRGNFDPGEMSEMLGKAGGQCERAGDLIRQIRRFAKSGPEEMSLVDVNRAVEEMTKLLSADPQSLNVQMDLRLAPGSPKARVVQIHLEQLILNLAQNALFSLNGSGTARPRLTIETREVDETIEVSVTDNGPGIPDHLTEQVFEPFVTSKTDGLGFGLFLCRSIVEGYGGKITFSQTPTDGTKFSFSLPAFAS